MTSISLAVAIFAASAAQADAPGGSVDAAAPQGDQRDSAGDASGSAQSARDAAGTAQPSPASASDASSVFFVQRNKNRNEVHYGIKLNADCTPAGKEPAYNYWLRLEKGPDVVEPLSFFQQRGYGFGSQKVAGEQVITVLRAIPDRPITFVAGQSEGRCSADATMTIAGEAAHVERVYVFAEEGVLLPEVKFVELFGKRDDGSPVHERIDID